MGPLADDEPFITEDFMLLEKFTSKVFVDKLLDKANALGLDGARYSCVVENYKDFARLVSSDMETI